MSTNRTYVGVGMSDSSARTIYRFAFENLITYLIMLITRARINKYTQSVIVLIYVVVVVVADTHIFVYLGCFRVSPQVESMNRVRTHTHA